MRCASPLGLGGTGRADALRFREGGRGTVRCFLAMALPLQSGFPAGEVFPPLDRHVNVGGLDLDGVDDRAPRVAAVGPSRHPARSIRQPQETGIHAGGGRGAHAGVALPGTRAHAQPRQHAGGGRRYRGDGARGGRLLARYGDAPPAPSARADGAAGAVDRAVGWPASPPSGGIISTGSDRTSAPGRLSRTRDTGSSLPPCCATCRSRGRTTCGARMSPTSLCSGAFCPWSR